MKLPSFVSLHTHTGFSLLDSMIRIPSLVKKVANDGQTAIAISDHGSLAGVVKFTDACNKAGIKPIIGEEFYVAPDSRHRKKYPKGAHTASHLILLASNERGWNNLRRLSTLAYTEGYYRKPRIDHALLAEHASGLIATSACIGGDVSVHLQAGANAEGEGKVEFDPDLAALKLAWYFGLFEDRFFIETQEHPTIDKQTFANAWYRDQYPTSQIIATTDCHYLNAEDWDTHDTLLCANTAAKKYDPDRWRFQTDQCWCKTRAEMAEIFPLHEIENTQRVADMVDFELPLRKQFFMPKLPADILLDRDDIPMNGKSYIPSLSPENLFRRECSKGLLGRLNVVAEKLPNEYRSRMTYEMDIFVKAGFVEYTLVLWDLMRYCREKNIFTGDGRGSAAGSLVMYALGIVNVDPIARECVFERFINPGRLENFAPPDVDLDFPRSRRQEVIAYLRRRYGEDRVCQIGTYSTLGAAALVKRIGATLGIDYGVIEKIAGIIPDGESSLQGAGPAAEPHGLSLDDVWRQSEKFQDIIEGLGDQGAWLMHYGRALQSLGTHSSTHASGVIVTDRPVGDVVPLMLKDNVVMAQLDMGDVEAFGLIKFDILGLETLDVLASVQEMVRKHEDHDFDFARIDLDDPAAYDMLNSGRTMGIFQASGGGFARLIAQGNPRSVEDLAILTSLCRPGPTLSGDTERYLKRRQGAEAVTYDIPELEPILGRNHGVLCFQEDLMRIAHELAGFSLAEADELRKVMGKKQIDKMPEYREQLVNGLERVSGVSPHLGDKLFDKLLPLAEYVFNRSHAMAYSYTTAKCAYAKAHYPAYFLAAAMTADVSGTGQGEDIPALVRDSQLAGCTLFPPDINLSESGYVAESRKLIRVGFQSIKGVGPAATAAILLERATGGDFRSIDDFRARIPKKAVNSRVVATLQSAGAFGELDWYDQESKEERAKREFDTFGFFMSAHPCAIHRLAWTAAVPNLCSLIDVENDWMTTQETRFTKYGRKKVTVYRSKHIRVVLTRIEKKKSKKTGAFMFMVDIEDETHTMKMILNATQLAKWGNPAIEKGSILDIVGHKADTEKWNGYFEPSILTVWS